MSEPIHLKIQLKLSLWARVKVFLGVRPIVMIELRRSAKGQQKEKAAVLVWMAPLFGSRLPPGAQTQKEEPL